MRRLIAFMWILQSLSMSNLRLSSPRSFRKYSSVHKRQITAIMSLLITYPLLRLSRLEIFSFLVLSTIITPERMKNNSHWVISIFYYFYCINLQIIQSISFTLTIINKKIRKTIQNKSIQTKKDIVSFFTPSKMSQKVRYDLTVMRAFLTPLIRSEYLKRVLKLLVDLHDTRHVVAPVAVVGCGPYCD